MSAKTKRICVLAVGTALFVVLSLCLQVPVFENYYLCLGYVVMAVYCYSFGPLDGVIVGCLGVVLYCVVISGLRGMPGWALGNIVIGMILGAVFGARRFLRSVPVRTVVFIAAVIVSSALGILVVKSLTECVLYGQPFVVRVGKNMSAFIADAAMFIISLPICAVLDKPARKMFPELCAKQRLP